MLRTWKVIPTICKKCKARYPSRYVRCIDCNSLFLISSTTQYTCDKNSFPLPKRCKQCKEELNLFVEAFKKVRARTHYSVIMEFHTVSLLGFKTGTRVGAVRGQRDHNLVAEIALERNDFGDLCAITKWNECE